MDAESIWARSRRAHRRGQHRVARLGKAAAFSLFHAVLPPEAEVGKDLQLGHKGLGVVVHPNTTIGDQVLIWHHVTLAVSAPPGHTARITVGSNVVIGAGTVVVTRDRQSLTIGDHAVIGANSVVTRDVPAGMVVAGNPAQVIKQYDPARVWR